MNEKEILEFNRRDFLKSGSVATLMSVLGGVELLAASARVTRDAFLSQRQWPFATLFEQTNEDYRSWIR